MEIEIQHEPMDALLEYASISIAFHVDRILDVHEVGESASGWSLSERVVNTPYVKDYDVIDGGPNRWADRFDLSNWTLLIARLAADPVGGIAVAYQSSDLDMLEGRSDLALIWDLRVQAVLRRGGIGTALFREAERWARQRNCRQLKVETQNINVAACRFYQRQGFELGAVHPLAYKDLPDEIQLLWYKGIRSQTL